LVEENVSRDRAERSSLEQNTLSQSILKNVLIGVAAGLLATLVSVLLSYVVGVVVTLVAVDELAAAALAALTVLPIMLLFFLLPLSLAIAFGTGLVLAVVSHRRQRPVGAVIGALVALVLAELILSLIAPLVFGTSDRDFIDIIGNPLLSASYGIVLGGLTGFAFRLLAQRDGPGVIR
jgi:hypothetical protein